MSTHVTAAHELDGDVEAVLAVLTSPEWPARKAAELRDGSEVVLREERPDGGVLMSVSRELPSGGVPGFLERFLPADGRVVQTDEWDPPTGSERRGRWSASIPGAPAGLGGTLLLTPTGAGCRYVVEGEVTVRVPLIGGKAERFLGDLVVKLADKEAQLLSRSLG